MRHTAELISPDSERYKIVPNSAKWKAHNTARLQISVPCEPCYDVKFRALANWTVQNFDNVTLCLHDTIQRYNIMASGISEADAYEMALKNGEVWLEKNILPCDVFIDVLRWAEVEAKPKFSVIHDEINALYKSNRLFAEAINHDVEIFADRCLKRGELFGAERTVLSKALLLNEISGYVLLNQESSAADIHAGMRMKAMQLLLDGLGGFNLRDNVMVTIRTFDRNQYPDRPNIRSGLALVEHVA